MAKKASNVNEGKKSKKSSKKAKEDKVSTAGETTPAESAVNDKEFRHLVRIMGIIVDGNKDIVRAISKVKGIGSHASNAVVYLSGFDKKTRVGELTDSQIEKIENTVKDLPKNAPDYILNRRKDYSTGKNIHLTGPDLDMSYREDITREIRMKSYRGIRHSMGLPVRGQRTQTSFRHNKTLGVVRKKK